MKRRIDILYRAVERMVLHSYHITAVSMHTVSCHVSRTDLSRHESLRGVAVAVEGGQRRALAAPVVHIAHVLVGEVVVLEQVQQGERLGHGERQSELGPVVVVEHRAELVLLQRPAHLAHANPHLRGESRLALDLLVLPSRRVDVRAAETRGLENAVQAMRGIIVQEKRKARLNGPNRVAVSLREAEQSSLEVVVHRFVVTNEDVTAKNLVSGQGFGGRKRLVFLIRRGGLRGGRPTQGPGVRVNSRSCHNLRLWVESNKTGRRETGETLAVVMVER
eukprot:TRINITY_DN3734_c0_g1_i1.p1 TRINITY_DN3734_c0_g1~~TRINITY_DN3734_c0_g1_i1.p1  ORF type:complete len:277 (+),score=-41.80 TRINITY_DN3734_c0_g1_i1:988-1818(+)